MKKKLVSAGLIIGLAFSLMGGLFTFLGAAWWLVPGDPEQKMHGSIPVLAGIGLLAIGMIFLFAEITRRRRAKELMENGRYLWGEIAELEANYIIRINHRHPYYAFVRYNDSCGKMATFRSVSSMALRNRDDLIGRKVKVYYEDNTYKKYHVDLDSLL